MVFFTNHFPEQSPVNLVTYLNSQAEIYRLKQIHSDIVFSTEEINQQVKLNAEVQLLEGDGIFTTESLQSVWSASADCTPILIADQATGKVAAIHSGWRGTASEIALKAIALFLAQGSKREDLLFALGPAINGAVYQVAKEVAVQVVSTIIPNSESLSSESIIEQAKGLPSSIILEDEEIDKLRLDVTQTINQQIQQQGISPDKIAIAPYCTYQTPELFFSYRRSRLKKNQWSGIISL